MQLHATAMSGPEFLDAVADVNMADGLDINADAFRSRALEWSRDLSESQRKDAVIQAMADTMAEIRRFTMVL